MSEAPLLDPSDLDDFRAGEASLNLEAAIAELRGVCGWHIAPIRTETMTLAARDGIVVLPTLRATGVVVVSNGFTLAADEYTLKPGYLVLRDGRTSDLVVTLTHGYDELPADLKRVALSMADSGTMTGGRLKTAGPFTYEFPDGSTEADTVGRYRLTQVA